MYKLMLVTREPGVLAAFEAVNDWEYLGIRAPRILSSFEEAADSLQRHHVDAVAVALPREESDTLTAYLNEHYPLLPILYLDTGDGLRELLAELSRFLGRLKQDNEDAHYDRSENLRRIRHDYFRRLISGGVKDAPAVRRQLGLMRSRMDPGCSCMLMSFRLPENSNEYLAGRWHYGNERLEIAMRNIFGNELAGMRLLVSVLEDGRIYLLACPMLGTHLANDVSMSDIVTGHAEDAIAHVAEYLGIDMRIDSVHELPAVTVLADEAVRRSLGIH